MEVQRDVLLIRELLRTDTCLLSADIYSLKSDTRDDLPLILVCLIEVFAVIKRVALLRSELLIKTAPTEDTSDPCILCSFGDHILGIVEIDECSRSSAHHLRASEPCSHIEIVIGPVRIDFEHLIQEIRECEIVTYTFQGRHGHVCMRIDHARHDNVARSIDVPVHRTVISASDRCDNVILDHHIAPQDVPVRILCDDPCIAYRRNHGPVSRVPLFNL